MALLRIRITSFLTGFGVCSAFALYQLRQDVLKSNSAIISQVPKGAAAHAWAPADRLPRWACTQSRAVQLRSSWGSLEGWLAEFIRAFWGGGVQGRRRERRVDRSFTCSCGVWRIH